MASAAFAHRSRARPANLRNVAVAETQAGDPTFRRPALQATVGGMDRPGTPADIERIEARIETLQEASARCRKLARAAKIAIAAGAACLVLTLLGLVPFIPTLLFASLAALIGGVVLLGSNSTTWKQTEAALAASEGLRRDLIEQLELRVIDDNVPTLH